MSGLLTNEEFEKEYPMEALEHIPAIFHAAILLYQYGAYLKGYNQGTEEMGEIISKLINDNK